MWISVAPGNGQAADLLLPPQVGALHIRERAVLKYGAGERSVTVGQLPEEAGGGSGESQANPVRVQVAREVMAELRMRPEPVYQLRVDGETIEIGPVLGLLLGNRNHWYSDSYLSREPERVTGVYPATGGLFCAFAARNYSAADRCAYGLYFDPTRDRWSYGELPVPSVVHRRSFMADRASVQRVLAVPGLQMFNSRRFDKWELYQLLAKDARLRVHLPETVQAANTNKAMALLRRHHMVVLKPADLSRGRGILFAQRLFRQYRVIDCQGEGEHQVTTLTKPEMERLLADLGARRYLVQQRVDLATIDEAPFDVRIVMQRGSTGAWSESAIEVRLAGHGRLVTNIAYGGRALFLPNALELAFGRGLDPAEAEAEAVQLSRRICEKLDATGECFAEFGIDLALDNRGRYWIIEANVIPTFKGFAALDPRIYRRLLGAPLLYAATLAGFGVPGGGGEEHD